jgi:hypothetical protein
MKLLPVISLLLLAAVVGHCEDIIFFADDHYKSLGQPQLAASVADPVLEPGQGVLQISLANHGRLEEIMPINESGSREDMLQEMNEEMKAPDAQNVNAALLGAGPVQVLAGPEHIESLPAGARVLLQFNVTAEKNASGWYDLALPVTYERQVDASVKNAEVFPLYETEKNNLTVAVFVDGSSEPLRISAVSSSLYPGGSGSLMAAISNDGPVTLHSCSVRLLAAPPFFGEDREAILGDLSPGSVSVAAFAARVQGDAAPQDYQLGCMVRCKEMEIVLPLPITLRSASLLDYWPVASAAGLAVALAAILFWIRGMLSARGRRRPKQS